VAVVQGVFGKLLVTSVDCGPSISWLESVWVLSVGDMER
jgi:hypothetical protein